MSGLPRPCLCLVTNRRLVAPDARTPDASLLALERFLDEALAADLDLIQIRERDVEARRLAGLVSRTMIRRGGRPVRVLVNDRADVAVAGGADGVHLRGDGPPVAKVRALGPESWIVGRSVHSVEEARVHGAADYLLFGTVFAGGSKEQPGSIQGLDALAGAVAATAAPVLAIGGVTAERAPSVMASGAAGAAAIGVFLPEGRAPSAEGPVRAAAALRAALLRSRIRPC